MANVPQDKYRVGIKYEIGEMTESGERVKQDLLFNQYFEDDQELKAFQQDELLQIQAAIAQVMVKWGDKQNAKKQQRRER